jgi:hypothetical protein
MVVVTVDPPPSSQVKVLDTPDGVSGSDQCVLTCSGVGRWNLHGWIDAVTYPGKTLMKIDIEGCGFTSTPVVTATTAAGEDLKMTGVVCPSIFVGAMKASSKYVIWGYSVEDTTASWMNYNQCNVYWTAIGYNCKSF